MAKSKTKAEKLHLSKVAALGCIACQMNGYEDTPASIHHIRNGVGMGQRSSHFHTIPLCPHHHQWGPDAIHHNKTKFEANYGTELELLETVNQMVKVAA